MTAEAAPAKRPWPPVGDVARQSWARTRALLEVAEVSDVRVVILRLSRCERWTPLVQEDASAGTEI